MQQPSEQLVASLSAAGALPVGTLQGGTRWFVPTHGPIPLVLDLIGDETCAVPTAINEALAHAARSKSAMPPQIGRTRTDTLTQRCDFLLSDSSSQHTDTVVEWLPNETVAEYWCAHLAFDWFEPTPIAPTTYHAK